MEKSICYHFTVTGVPIEKRLAFMAIVNALAEYVNGEVGGNADSFVLDTRTSDKGMAKARSWFMESMLVGIGMVVNVKRGGRNVKA